MIRALACSAPLAVSLAFALSGCGGGGGTPGALPGTTTTTAQTGAVMTTTTGAEKKAEEEEAAPLLAWADASPEEGQAPLTVEFKADVEGGTPPLKYTWAFGDGTPNSSEANPKHVYEKAGKFRADLTVNDNAGDSDTDYIEIEVR